MNNAELKNFANEIQHEWLETNGIGGWSSSTVINCNTRRYHGLLVAATAIPAGRMNLVSKIDETIVAGDNRYQLGVNDYGNIIDPMGFQYQEKFEKRVFPEFVFEVNGIRIKKTIAMIHGENTVVIQYEVLESQSAFSMELAPLLSARGYHNLIRANQGINQSVTFNNHTLSIRPYPDSPEIFIRAVGSNFQYTSNWFYNFNYSAEKERGLDFIEDLFNPGLLIVELDGGSVFHVILSTENPDKKVPGDLLLIESDRRRSLQIDNSASDLISKLILAADQFIVRRDIPASPLAEGFTGATIIAGYHWFTDWGRDTMISLPGLCLATGRLEDAKKILLAFARNISKGMLPNRFQDNNELPEYNNVDGTLWYFIAVYKYLQASDDIEFVLKEILPALKDIIDWHFRGTRYNIHAEDDGLLFAGEKGQQLTWMDARIGDWVVTPRMGRPVEVQALWYNTLKIFSELLMLNNQEQDAELVEISAQKTKDSFGDRFWNADGNYLYDNIDENEVSVPELRPNQLFAISLPFALIDGEQAAKILQTVTEKLATPVGLRSLSPDDSSYIGTYGGDPWHRDSAYHQGTVWSWLLGPYIDAIMKVEGSKQRALEILQQFSYHLNEAGIGSVSEIFDGYYPHRPAGCIAQAWGVAELLRVTKEYQLYDH